MPFEKATKKLKVETNDLPPLESLDPKQLKNFNRQELSSYLQDAGFYVSQVDSKPALKKAIRHLMAGDLDLVKETLANPDEKIDESELVKETFRDKAMNAALSSSNFPLLQTKPNIFQTFASEDIENEALRKTNTGTGVQVDCIDCHKKKANRECLWQRCKQCCAKAGQTCHIHRIEGSAGAANVLHGAVDEAFVSDQVDQVASLLKECPSCQKEIADVGNNFVIHLRLCDPDLFQKICKKQAQWRKNENVKEKPEIKNGINLIQEQLEKSEYKKQVLEEIFSPTPTPPQMHQQRHPSFSQLVFQLENQVNRLQNEVGQLKKQTEEMCTKQIVKQDLLPFDQREDRLSRKSEKEEAQVQGQENLQREPFADANQISRTVVSSLDLAKTDPSIKFFRL